MSTIGTVESLWRYPVKSMRRGEELGELFASYAEECMAIAFLLLKAQRAQGASRFSPDAMNIR